MQLRPQDPYGELSEVMNEFFTNEDIANDRTMVSIEDLCKMLSVAAYLGQEIENRREETQKTAAFIGKRAKNFKIKYD